MSKYLVDIKEVAEDGQETDNEYVFKASNILMSDNTDVETAITNKPGEKYLVENVPKGEIFNNYANNKAPGNYSHAEGYYSSASGYASHAEGSETSASGDSSHAEGGSSTASGDYSHSEGRNTTASGNCSHAEGENTVSSGETGSSHAEGSSTTASGAYGSHAEGSSTTASGTCSHAEGGSTEAVGHSSHAEGNTTKAYGRGSHAEGEDTVAGTSEVDPNITYAAHAEGYGAEAIGKASHAEGGFRNSVDTADLANKTYTSTEIPSLVDDTITVSGPKSHGLQSHAEGTQTLAYAYSSHAEGYQTLASGNYSHVEGYQTLASGSQSHAEGNTTTASGAMSHSEGGQTTASGTMSHAEGYHSSASGYASHAEGSSTTASGNSAHAEGTNTDASGDYSHAEGGNKGSTGAYNKSDIEYTSADIEELGDETITISGPTAYGIQSHAEGTQTFAYGYSSHAEGDTTIASGNSAHAEGYQTKSSGNHSHSEGHKTEAYGNASHVEGGKLNILGEDDLEDITYNATNIAELGVETITVSGSMAYGTQSHAEGTQTLAYGYGSHAEGHQTIASGLYSHAEGYQTTASGINSHAEGSNADAVGKSSHAEGGFRNNNDSADLGDITYTSTDILELGDQTITVKGPKSYGLQSHAEGTQTLAYGYSSHAEGCQTIAYGNQSHAEGYQTKASGLYSHAEGRETEATGNYSHASGYCSIADTHQFVCGKNNVSSSGPAATNASGNIFIVGNGTGTSTRSNAFRLTTAGSPYAKGAYNASGADYAEYFEWKDANANKEDRAGLFVTLDGEHIRLANSDDDYILGVVSATPSVVGDSYFGDNWHDMYVRDVFGRILTEIVHVDQYVDEITEEVIEEHDEERPILNPDWDPNQAYESRESRDEWDAIGLMGKLIVIDDGTCEVNGYCKVSNDGKATKADKGYRVMSRIDDTHIKILFR